MVELGIFWTTNIFSSELLSSLKLITKCMKFQRILFISSANRLSEPNCLNKESGIIENVVHSIEEYMKSPSRRYLAFKLNLQVKIVERSKQDCSDNVTDENFVLILKSNEIQLGQIKFQVNFCAL